MTQHRGKRILEARAAIDREHEHSPAEAIATLKRVARAGFDESIEVHIRTGLNVRHADEQQRDRAPRDRQAQLR